MKNFMFNTAKGIRFYTELFCLLRDNNLVFDYDVFDMYCRIVFEDNSVLKSDVILALFKIAYRFDLSVESRADYNCLVFEFYFN